MAKDEAVSSSWTRTDSSDPSIRSRCEGDGKDINDDINSEIDSLEQLEEFGDMLRAAMTTQQKQRRLAKWKIPSPFSRKLSENQNAAQEKMKFGIDAGDEKSFASTVDEELVDDETENMPAMSTSWCCPAFLVSYFVVYHYTSNDISYNECDLEHQHKDCLTTTAKVSWEFNRDNIGWCLTIAVLLELVLVAGLLIAFLQ